MNVQNMAPNARRALLLAAVFGGLAAALYLGAVKPTQTRLAKARKTAAKVTLKHKKMKSELAGVAAIEERIAKARAELAPFEEALLRPLLESKAMRAKSILDPMAFGAGLHDLEYEALPLRALPLPKRPMPKQLHARSPIRIVAQGSYQAAVSFLSRVEKELPLVALQSLTVTVQKDPNEQKIEMVLEWPAKGAATRK